MTLAVTGDAVADAGVAVPVGGAPVAIGVGTAGEGAAGVPGVGAHPATESANAPKRTTERVMALRPPRPP
jgi:hypothetical protein